MVEKWKKVKLCEIADVKGGKRLPIGDKLLKEPTKHPYIRVADMIAGGIKTTDIHFISDDVFNKIKKYVIYSDDIFISVAGSLGIVGTVPVRLNGANLTENADRLTNIKISRDYLCYYLQSDIVQNEIKNASTVGAQPKLALTRIQQFDISFPDSMRAQEQIASVLLDVDSLINSLSELIEKKESIKNAFLEDLITGKRRLKGFDDEWENINLGETSLLKARIGWQGLTTSEYLESGFSYLITGTDFKKGTINWKDIHFVEKHRYDQDKNIQVKNGDLLLTKDGTIGKVALVKNLNKPATLNSGVFVIRPIKNRYLTEYVYYVLTSSVFRIFLNKLAAGSTISHLYQKDLTNFEFFLPSSLNEQKAVATILSDMDEEIFKLEEKLEKYKKIKQGMMEQLLTGKIRLA